MFIILSKNFQFIKLIKGFKFDDLVSDSFYLKAVKNKIITNFSLFFSKDKFFFKEGN